MKYSTIINKIKWFLISKMLSNRESFLITEALLKSSASKRDGLSETLYEDAMLASEIAMKIKSNSTKYEYAY